MANHLCFDITVRCRELLASITSEERTKLVEFANYRLKYYGMREHRDEELYQDAVCAIIRGWDGVDGVGRKANDWCLQDKAHFLKFVQGAIRSIANGWYKNWRSTQQRHHVSADLLYEMLMGQHKGHVEYLDLTRELFKRLYQQAPSRLWPTITAWKNSLDLTKIPCTTSRKHRDAVKKLAQKILAEMAITRSGTKSPAWVTSGSQAHTVTPEATAGVNEPFDS